MRLRRKKYKYSNNKKINIKLSNMDMKIILNKVYKLPNIKNKILLNRTQTKSIILPSFTKKIFSSISKNLMKKVAIIGAGVSGLYLANLLEKEKDFRI